MKVTIDTLHNTLRRLQKDAKFNKIFCIGSHKTGTTTLNHIMHGLGFNCAPQAKLERDCTLEVTRGNYQPLIHYIKQFDFFQDSPFAHAHTYIAIDALFPGSKFIYTYRDPNKWYQSNLNFVAKWCKTQPSELCKKHYESYGYISKDYMVKKTEYYEISQVNETSLACTPNWDLLFNKEKYIKTYIYRRNEILRYFQSRPDDLLVIDITAEATISKITDFIGYPSHIDFPTPILNSRNAPDKKDVEITNKLLERMVRDHLNH